MGHELKLTSLLSELENDNERPWMVVTKHNKHSAACGSHTKGKSVPRPTENEGLTWEQESVVAAAEENLTAQERIKIQRHCENMSEHNSRDSASLHEPSSKGEEPSKGKGIDPMNWGTVGIDSDELSVDTQEAILASWKSTHKESIKKDKNPPLYVDQAKLKPKTHIDHDMESENSVESNVQTSRKDKKMGRSSSKLTPMPETVANRLADAIKGQIKPRKSSKPEHKPVAQIAPQSYIGRVLQGVCERYATENPSDPLDDSSSLSSLSSSDLESETYKDRR